MDILIATILLFHTGCFVLSITLLNTTQLLCVHKDKKEFLWLDSSMFDNQRELNIVLISYVLPEAFLIFCALSWKWKLIRWKYTHRGNK